MIRSLFLLGFLCVAFPAVATEDPAVDLSGLELKTVAGEEWSLDEALKEGPVILDFWATWCGPCKRAMPAWADLAKKYAERGVQLVPISEDSPKMYERIQPWFDKKGFKFPSMVDKDQELARQLGVISLPTTLLVAPDGTITFRHSGYADGDYRRLEQELLLVLPAEDGS